MHCSTRPCRYMTAIRIPWVATDRSTELKLVADSSLSDSCIFLPFRNGPPPLRLMRFCDKCSPQRFEPPWVYGMLSRAMPWRCGPLARSSETPSHCVGIQCCIFYFKIRVFSTYHNINMFVKILAGCGKCLWGCVFEIPQFILHATVEFVWISFAL